MRLEAIMTRRVVGIGLQEAATTAWSHMQRERIRHLVVLDGKRLVGVLSERAVRERDDDTAPVSVSAAETPCIGVGCLSSAPGAPTMVP